MKLIVNKITHLIFMIIVILIFTGCTSGNVSIKIQTGSHSHPYVVNIKNKKSGELMFSGLSGETAKLNISEETDIDISCRMSVDEFETRVSNKNPVYDLAYDVSDSRTCTIYPDKRYVLDFSSMGIIFRTISY